MTGQPCRRPSWGTVAWLAFCVLFIGLAAAAFAAFLLTIRP